MSANSTTGLLQRALSFLTGGLRPRRETVTSYELPGLFAAAAGVGRDRHSSWDARA